MAPQKSTKRPSPASAVTRCAKKARVCLPNMSNDIPDRENLPNSLYCLINQNMVHEQARLLATKCLPWFKQQAGQTVSQDTVPFNGATYVFDGKDKNIYDFVTDSLLYFDGTPSGEDRRVKNGILKRTHVYKPCKKYKGKVTVDYTKKKHTYHVDSPDVIIVHYVGNFEDIPEVGPLQKTPAPTPTSSAHLEDFDLEDFDFETIEDIPETNSTPAPTPSAPSNNSSTVITRLDDEVCQKI